MRAAELSARRSGPVVVVMVACVMAVLLTWTPMHAGVGLLITDDNGLSRYDFTSATLNPLVSTASSLYTFTGVTVGPNGNAFVSANSGEVYRYDSNTGAQIGSGPFVSYRGLPPTPDPHDVINPQGLRFSPLNHNLYVADLSGSTANVHLYDSAGASLGALSDPTLNQPGDVAFDSAGNLYVVNPGYGNVLASASGTQPFTAFVTTQSGGLTNPIALTFGPDDKLYVLDGSSNSAVLRYNADGSFDTTFISFPLVQPSDLAFGPDGKLYVSGYDFMTGASEVLRFQSDGTADGLLLDSGLTNPHFIAFVPEPGSMLLIGAGLAWMGLLKRRGPGPRR